MNFNPELKFKAKSGEWLCFRHAVLRAHKAEDVEPVIDEFGSEYDFRDIGCIDCIPECWGPPPTAKHIDIDADASGSGSGSASIRVAIDAVMAERARQDSKWGEQNHEPQYWLGILGEEFGELCQAVNETVFNNGPKERKKGGYANMRLEAVQVAAVAVAFVEILDRRYRGRSYE